MRSQICALLVSAAGTAAAQPVPEPSPSTVQHDPVQPGAPAPIVDLPIPDVPPTPLPPTDDIAAPTIRTTVVPGPYSYAWREPGLKSNIGVGVTIGGGLTGFTDRTMRDTVSSNVGGLWDVRASIGTHIPIGLDLTYLGTAANVNTINGQANGTLIGTTTEAALRWNILPHNDLTPYIFGGVGWQHYDVRDMKFAQSDTGMKSSDNVAEFPMGAGLSLRDVSGFTADLRGTFRATTDSTLVLDGATNTYASLFSWEASAAVGYEF
jgi:hypothetical protein